MVESSDIHENYKYDKYIELLRSQEKSYGNNYSLGLQLSLRTAASDKKNDF